MSTVMRVIHRDDVSSINSVVVDGIHQNLGTLKRFDAHPALADFVEGRSRLSMGWVHLDPGERLEIHSHPIDSMIVVATGSGCTSGDIAEDFSDGDVILIPRQANHGFEGAGDHGFWALSVQFEAHGLYHDTDHPLVTFGTAAGEDPLTVDTLLKRNSKFAELHLRNPLVELLRSGRLADSPVLRRRLLDVVQVWSTYFQRAMFARSAFTDNPVFAIPFREHLADEFGHDADLERDRGNSGSTVWDPILEGAASWFGMKMLTYDDVDKAVLVHLVLEGGAEVVAPYGAVAFGGVSETDYFEKHQEADTDHRTMVDGLLAGHNEQTYRRLFETQRKGWEMLELVSARMAELTELAEQRA